MELCYYFESATVKGNCIDEEPLAIKNLLAVLFDALYNNSVFLQKKNTIELN
jgi:hypothetical protein